MDLPSVLRHAQNPDATIRNQAEEFLRQAVEAQYGPFMVALCGEFCTDGKPDDIRQLAGIYLKNIIHANDDATREAKKQKWVACDGASKDQIRHAFLIALQSSNGVVRHTAAQILAAYGSVDLPMNAWPNFVPTLMENVMNPAVVDGPRLSSLEALGYLCESSDPAYIDPAVVNQILSAIIDGLRADRPNEVRLKAISALTASLDFASNNFEAEGERDAIMMKIFEATQCPDIKIREKAYECMAKVADLYYDKLTRYIDTIFQLTTAAIKTDEQAVVTQAVEFWNTVCECELTIMEGIEDGDDGECLNIVGQAAAALIPVLLESLTKQSEDVDDDEDSFDIASSGAACLDLVTQTVKDPVVDMVLPFVGQNIQSPNWRLKDASMMAFACVLDGTTSGKMVPIVAQAMPVLIAYLQDPTMQVRETAAYTMSRICELRKDALSSEVLTPMVTALATLMDDPNSRVVNQALQAVSNLALACHDDKDNASNILSLFLQPMLQKLFGVTSRPVTDDGNNLRVGAYEAINFLVANSATDMRPVVLQVMAEAQQRLRASFSPAMEHGEKSNLQSSVCALLGVCVERLDELTDEQADGCMELLLQVFTTRAATAHEEAFLCIGNVIGKLEAKSVRYLPHLHAPMLAGLQSFDEQNLCIVVVGVAGDLCRSVGPEMRPICDDIVKCLIELLQSTAVNKIVKPHVISAFADIAMAIEGDFDRYLNVVLELLRQASAVDVDVNDDDMAEYVTNLNVAIFEAYSGIIQGLKSASKQDAALPGLAAIGEFIQKMNTDEQSGEVLKGAAGLIGDIGQAYGPRCKQLFQQPYIMEILQRAIQDEDSQTNGTWSQQVVMEVLR